MALDDLVVGRYVKAIENTRLRCWFEGSMSTAFLLIALGIAWRLSVAFHWLDLPNAVPLAALALFAAAKLPRKWAYLVPLAILLGSDLIIDQTHGYAFYYASRLTTYGTFMLIALAASYAPARISMPGRVLMAAGGATLFFLVSNFAVWAGGEGFGRGATLPGLLSTYVDGLPFYRRSLMAEVAGVVLLFGLDAIRIRLTQPALAEQEATTH